MQGELLIDHVWMVLNSANQDTPTMNELIHWLDQNYNFPEAFIKTQSDALHHLTRLEYCHLQLATLIRGCIVHVCIDTKKIPTMSMAKGTVLYPLDTVLAISSILITVKSTVQDVPLLVEGQGEDYIPDFKNTLHILYKAYQICLFVLASESFFTHLNVPGSVFSKKYYTDNIGNPVRAIVNKIKDVAKKVAKVVNADGVYYRKVVDWIGEGAEKNSEKSEDVEGTDTIGKALLGLLNSDKDFIQEFALDLSESWSESVQGLQVLH